MPPAASGTVPATPEPARKQPPHTVFAVPSAASCALPVSKHPAPVLAPKPTSPAEATLPGPVAPKPAQPPKPATADTLSLNADSSDTESDAASVTPGVAAPIGSLDSIRDDVFVEVFCGQANLSRAMGDLGFSVVPIDHYNKSTVCRVLTLDVLTDSGLALLLALLQRKRLFWVHFAPPCGTFSLKAFRLDLFWCGGPPGASASGLWGRLGSSGVASATTGDAEALTSLTGFGARGVSSLAAPCEW